MLSALDMAECMPCTYVKLPNLKLKTRPKQLLGSLTLDIVLPPPPFLAYVLMKPSYLTCTIYPTLVMTKKILISFAVTNEGRSLKTFLV